MSLAASPAGVDRAPAAAAFSRPDACALAGLSLGDLAPWDSALGAEAGTPLPARFTFADVLALAVLSALIDRLGWRAGAFTLGVGQLFEVLAARPDAERLDDHALLVGRDFARLAELRTGHVRCSGDDFVVVPLRPILTRLRGQVFP